MQHVQFDMRLVFRHHRQRLLALCTVVAPNSPDAAPLVAQASAARVLATLGHLALRSAKPARKSATRAQPPGCVEIEDGLRPLESQRERLVVVPVDDPRLAGDQRALPLPPLAV